MAGEAIGSQDEAGREVHAAEALAVAQDMSSLCARLCADANDVHPLGLVGDVRVFVQRQAVLGHALGRCAERADEGHLRWADRAQLWNSASDALSLQLVRVITAAAMWLRDRIVCSSPDVRPEEAEALEAMAQLQRLLQETHLDPTTVTSWRQPLALAFICSDAADTDCLLDAWLDASAERWAARWTTKHSWADLAAAARDAHSEFTSKLPRLFRELLGTGEVPSMDDLAARFVRRLGRAVCRDDARLSSGLVALAASGDDAAAEEYGRLVAVIELLRDLGSSTLNQPVLRAFASGFGEMYVLQARALCGLRVAAFLHASLAERWRVSAVSPRSAVCTGLVQVWDAVRALALDEAQHSAPWADELRQLCVDLAERLLGWLEDSADSMIAAGVGADVRFKACFAAAEAANLEAALVAVERAPTVAPGAAMVRRAGLVACTMWQVACEELSQGACAALSACLAALPKRRLDDAAVGALLAAAQAQHARVHQLAGCVHSESVAIRLRHCACEAVAAGVLLALQSTRPAVRASLDPLTTWLREAARASDATMASSVVRLEIVTRILGQDVQAAREACMLLGEADAAQWRRLVR